MQVRDLKQQSVGIHDFAMNPRAEIPRSTFPIRQGLKTAFSASYLVPIFVEEVLPGDTFNVTVNTVCRTATPIVPVLDNWHMEFFAFFTPNRLVWGNFTKMLGEQVNPDDSIDYTFPQVSVDSTMAVGSLYDYMGIPVQGQLTGSIDINALPLRMYNLIYNQWFRDQNLQDSLVVPNDDGPDLPGQFTLVKRGKRPDYFTMCLPWPQKGDAVVLPLGTSAPVRTSLTSQVSGAQDPMRLKLAADGSLPGANSLTAVTGGTGFFASSSSAPGTVGTSNYYPDNLYADLASATGPTVNLFRQYFQTQKFMERQARGGTRYIELVQSQYGVRPPDFRLARPEYIGGGKIPVLTNAIPQTSATGLTGGTTPAGNLAATGYAHGAVHFNYSSQEHGYIIVLVNVRADLTYQQGLRRHWSRQTALDIYFPVFAMLGEQAVLNREIYCDGSASDDNTFGFIPRWDEYRHFPSQITGLFRSTAAGTLDYWHTSQEFTTVPTLNSQFITDETNAVLNRNFAGGSATQGQQFLCDFMFTGRAARPLPVHSVPGMIDHF